MNSHPELPHKFVAAQFYSHLYLFIVSEWLLYIREKKNACASHPHSLDASFSFTLPCAAAATASDDDHHEISLNIINSLRILCCNGTGRFFRIRNLIYLLLLLLSFTQREQFSGRVFSPLFCILFSYWKFNNAFNFSFAFTKRRHSIFLSMQCRPNSSKNA